MCALPEYNLVASNQNQLLKPTLLNMALMHSLNCASDRLSCDCALESIKVTIPIEESGNISISPTNVTDTCNMFDKTQNLNEKKSLYKSKSCKYSFLASDYTSPEGQKLLSIKIYQKPIEVESSNSKGKSFLSKRSISEYFLSKNGHEKDLGDEKGKDLLLKSWQRTFSKPQSLMPQHVEEYSNCDMTNAPDSRRDSTVLNSSDVVQPSHKSSYSLQLHKFSALDSEPGPSECTEENRQGSVSDDKLAHKSSNTNPNVNFKVFDIESLSEAGEPCDSGSQENNVHFGMDDAWFIPSARHTFSGADISGSASAAQLSIASSFGDNSLPTCKICHTAAKPEDPLISPCRCTGTLRYIHCGCLMVCIHVILFSANCKKKKITIFQ